MSMFAKGGLAESSLTSFSRCIIANCIIFDVVGTTLSPSAPATIEDSNIHEKQWLSLLKDAEGNHCSSLPAVILHVLHRGALVRQRVARLDSSSAATTVQQDEASCLLQIARSFDARQWATDVQSRSPAADLQARFDVASAHRGAVCIYISRICLQLGLLREVVSPLEDLVTEVIAHLSNISTESPLFVATTWPSFIAGAETNDSAKHVWIRERFQQIQAREPWGVIGNAAGLLEKIWQKRSVGLRQTAQETSASVYPYNDWLDLVSEDANEWLIL
ncbi:hypothetical protein LTR86_004214 [Recurvomyces mirabilis]|nr:hypothetical protein LTR86_004214 [Recurvomyces mirabilis]